MCLATNRRDVVQKVFSKPFGTQADGIETVGDSAQVCAIEQALLWRFELLQLFLCRLLLSGAPESR